MKLSKDALRGYIEIIFCPECGKKAVTMKVSPWGESYVVAPLYSCDTPGCEFSTEGPFFWTPDFLV